MTFVIVYHNGKLFRIERIPFETDEQAYDRAWYVALHANESNQLNKSFKQQLSEASRWVNEKYLGMKYRV